MEQSLTGLPPNILTEILTRLPLKTLFASRCVCKTFLNLTTPNPHFNHLHSPPQSLLLQFEDVYSNSIPLHLIDPELDLLPGFVENFRPWPIFQMPELRSREENRFLLANSCNGLIYLVNNLAPDEHSLVCNPVTNEYIVIPDVDLDQQQGRFESMWLGFSPGSNQYKVLRKSCSVNGEYVGAQVLLVGSNSWRKVEDRPLLGRDFSWDAWPTFLNGLIHWIDQSSKDICFFDFERELFGAIPLPSEFREEEELRLMYLMSTGVIGGCLCVSYNDFNAQLVDIWMMKKHGDKGSWRKEFVVNILSLPIIGRFKPLQFLANGEILLLWIGYDLVCYDPRTNSVRFLGFNLMRLNPRTVTFTPSFISLKDAVLVDKVLVQNVRPRCHETAL